MGRDNLRHRVLTALVVLALGWSPLPAEAADVRALVVGVTAGGPQAVQGARELARRFRRMGFAVEHLEEPDKATLEAGIDRLVTEVPGTRMVIFAFGGHGLQLQNRNYLIPAGATVATPGDIATKLVALSRVFNGLQGQRQRGVVKLIILDACRAIPPDRWLAAGPPPEGLAKTEGEAPINSFVSFATRPGSLAADGTDTYSPYTAALLAAMPARGRPLGTIFERARENVLRKTKFVQVPSDESFLDRDVALLPAVTVHAGFGRCDDIGFLFRNKELVASCSDNSGPTETFSLEEGDNELLVGIFNQHTFRGHNALFGAAEGWSYSLHVARQGVDVACMESGEDTVARNGPRHGRYFVASRLILHVDRDTGAIRIADNQPELCRSP